MASITDLAQAIARFEGYNQAGSIAQRNNNPGNLRSWGSYPVVNGFVQFPDAATGWAALESQIQTNINRGLTLDEFFGGKPGVYPGYAPAADSNQPSTYASTVASWLGISADAPLSDMLDVSGGGSLDASLSDWTGMNTVEAALAVGVVAALWMVFR